MIRLMLAVVALGGLLPGAVRGDEKTPPPIEAWQIDGIASALQDGREGVRELAVIELAKLLKDQSGFPNDIRVKVEPHLPNLNRLFQGQNKASRLAAAELLGRLGDRPAVGPLISALKTGAVSDRVMAAEFLGQFGDRSAVMPLIDALKDPYEYVRLPAAASLGRLGDRSAIGPLVNALKDREPSVRRAAAESLARLGDRSAIEPLIDTLIRESVSDRVRGAELLGWFGDRSAIGPLVNALKDREPSVRRAAAESLARLGDRSAIEPLIDALKTGNTQVQRDAAVSLGRLGDRSTVAPLVDALKTGRDVQVLRAAAEALGQIGERKSVKSVWVYLKTAQGPEELDDGHRQELKFLTRHYPLVALALIHQNASLVDRGRWFAHYHGADDTRDPERFPTLLRYLGRPKDAPPRPMVLLDARKHLDALTWAWTESLDLLDVENSRYLREDIARAVTRVVSGPGRWEKQDIERLTKARDLLNENSVDDSSAPAVQRALDPLTLATPPWVRSLLAFGAINLLGAGVYFLAVRIGGLGRWLPFAVPVVTGLGVGAADARDFAQQVFKTDARLLLGLLAAEGLVLVAAGVASPGVLRALARTEPFNRVVVPLAMRIPWSRRRFFRDYVRGVRQWLALSRERAAGEQYAPLPATVRSDDQRESALSADPAAAVLRQLTADVDQPGAVLVAAPGGRGKSALLRAVVERALDAFERHPARAPLPVVPSATRATVLETLATALGPELASPEFLPLHLAAGDFFLVLDGVTEVGPAAEEIDAFVRSDGRRTPVLLAARPDPGYEDAVRRFPHWLAAEPVPLDDAALDQFVEHYGGAPFSPELRSACRGPDGYVPLLVRMTMTVAGGAGEPRTIADVYYAHFIRLFDAQFRGDEQKKISQLQAAARWCLDTYWRDGRRRLPFDGAELPSALLRAGVLVGAGAGGTPREVAFFHDSVQSYLTAYGLWRLDADGYKNPPACPPGMVWELPRVLLRAAGVPAFTRAQTVIVTAGGSELFQMCVAVFGAGRLRPVLRDELLRWARDHEENLRRQDVLGTLPPGVRATAEKKRGVTNVLTAAAEEAFRLDGSDGGARRLAQIYSGLAPEVCILEHVQDPQG